MATNLDLDPDLVERALTLSGAPTEKAAVTAGLAPDPEPATMHSARLLRTSTRPRSREKPPALVRLQLLPQVAITPDVQLIVNPALAPEREEIWVVGLRTRVTF